jgi:hypothetical protein
VRVRERDWGAEMAITEYEQQQIEFVKRFA